jgi:hypothetical protein
MEPPPLMSGGQSDPTETGFASAFEGVWRLVQSYQNVGAKLYQDNPEALSAAQLTILELWVAMDSSAVQLVSLLRQYDPGLFRPGLFDGLVLLKGEQLRRLARVEDYLERRRAGAGSNGSPWRFHDGGGSWSKTCFAACYYDSSPHHQRLYRIVKEAAEAVQAAAAASRWEAMMAETGQRHSPYPLHRPGFYLWPLFWSETEAKAIIFEADVPAVFAMWREITRRILAIFGDVAAARLPGTWRRRWEGFDLGRAADELAREVDRRLGQPGLLPRAELDKLFGGVERPLIAIGKELRQISGGGGGGGGGGSPDTTQPVSSNNNVSRPSYASGKAVPEVLRRWIASTAHTPNEVLAARPQCPPTMAPDEFRAFGDLRAGRRLQWHNILLQLTVPSLNISRPDVFCLIMQAAHEAGPRGDAHGALRSTHAILGEVRFGNALLGGLEDTLGRIAHQPNAEVALCVLVSLAVRLLSVSPHRQVQGRCLAYLRRLRGVGQGRARASAAQLEVCDTADEARRASLAQRTELAALACHATFDVGAPHYASVLLDDDEAAVLVESAIRAAEHAAPRLPDHAATPALDVLRYRRHRLAYEMEPRLRDCIVGSAGRCLNTAIRRFWPSCRRSLAWSPAPAPHAHVLAARLSLPGRLETLLLEYNLLTGSLLIGGAPLTGLPPHVREHPTYRLLFGDRAFTVEHSYTRSQGLQYLVTSSYHGHKLHLAVLEGDWLLVGSEKDGTRYEFIPPEDLHRGLGHGLPRRLLDGYAHWLVLDEDRVEFRPLANAWKPLQGAGPSCGGYVLKLDDGGHGARLTKVGSAMTSVRATSETARAVCHILRPLEQPELVDLAFDRHRRVLSIDLPRLRLSFRLARGQSALVSSQYAGYSIDEDQSIGTLAGFESKLVLRRSPHGTLALPSTRLLLVPAGEVSFEIGPHGRAGRTRISTAAAAVRHVRYHAFRVDATLGCLRSGDGALGSLLLLCRLHALTTHCLPDRLTGRTGTEESLRILDSVAVQLPGRLLQGDDGDDEDHLGHLRRIGGISPLLSRDDESGQRVRWSSAAPRAAQDGVFSRRVAAILGQAGVTTELPPVGDASLVRRAVARTSAYCAVQYSDHGDGATEPSTGPADVMDPGWAASSTGYDSEVEACCLARHIVHGDGAAALLRPIRSPALLETQVEGQWTSPFSGMTNNMARRELAFSMGWLVGPYPIPAERWQRLLSEVSAVHVRRDGAHVYNLAFFLAGLACAPKADAGIIHLLLTMATAPRPPFSPANHQPELIKANGAFIDAIQKMIDANQNLFRADQNLIDADEKVRSEDRGVTQAHGKANPRFISHLGEEAQERAKRALENAKRAQKAAKRAQKAAKQAQENAKELQQRCAIAAKRCHKDLAFHISWLPSSRNLPAPPAALHLPTPPPPPRRGGPASVDDMFTQPAPEPPVRGGVSTRTGTPRGAAACGAPPRALQRFIGSLGRTARLEHERRYVKELRRAAKALGRRRRRATPATPMMARRGGRGASRLGWLEHMEACRREVACRFAAICDALGAAAMPGEAGRLEAASRPAVTPVMLLERLSRRHRATLSDGWLRCLVDYALALTALQRAERLVMAAATGNRMALAAERRNVGHENWDPVAFPDWLLLEVDMDILIRPLQARVASAMLQPPGKRNRVMQLHMGEGKSSVIVPMVAAALADGSRLVRVVVAKAQSKQMLHTLTRALGGLLGRGVYPLPPFARGAGHEIGRLASAQAGCVRCLSGGGVVVAQPEHLLSFRLAGVEATLLAGGDETSTPAAAAAAAAAGPLLAMQRLLDRRTRDIVDESDEVFHTRSELIYPMGPPQAVDLGARRWRLIQSVLALVAEIAPAVRDEHPGVLEVGPGLPEGRFAPVRILSETGATALADRLVQRIFDGGLVGLPHVADPKRRHAREVAARYVREPEPAAGDVATVEAMFAAGELPERPLLLLRGLVARGVLCFGLRKRWGVDYGRTDTRDPPTGLAVPFRAKGLPTPRSEFGHPDVVIVLTCLSYYYSGLSSEELRASLERLALSADGERRYTSWVLPTLNSTPRPPNQLSAIDLQDHQHYASDVLPRLYLLRPVIDYYLSELLFEREMREFRQALSTSAWSLAKVKPQPTTGFSGTHDAKCLLPLSISFLDMKEQRHAKAQVLGCLLRPENTVQDLAAPFAEGSPAARRHDPFSTRDLLRVVVDAEPPIRVLIDVGAQITGLSNAEVARRWLDLVPRAKASAAVFFDSHESMCVVTRDGIKEPFLTSPYVANTAPCLVFLDEAHARGTDIRLPGRSRAAVTLGPMLTKDRLVQGTFFSPPPPR